MLGPVLLEYATEEQKQKFLPGIVKGEIRWCQGYSEPGAGSDLASLKTKAERITGDDGKEYYLVNGQKTWTTLAQFADWGFFLVRTDPTAKKQEGISFLLIDLKTPGIKIDPIITMGLDHEVNQVFFDDVRVPVENRVGEENQGWEYAKFLLEFERGGGSSGYLKAGMEKLKSVVSSQVNGNEPLIRDPRFAAELASIEVGVMAQEITELRMMSKLAAGQPPGAESSIMKSTSVDLGQRMSELMVEALDYYATPMPAGGRPLYEINDWLPGPEYAPPAIGTYLNKRASSIFGGSNEVQRDIIAKLVLRL
jgi:hypothetical protein